MSNDWTDKLRDHLADYQEPVKDDLWAAIEQSLAQQGQNSGDSQKDENLEIGAGRYKDDNQQTNAVVPTHVNLQPKAIQVKLRRFSMAAAIAALAIGGTYVYLHPWNQAGTEMAEKKSAKLSDTNTPGKSKMEERTLLASTEDSRLNPNSNLIAREKMGRNLQTSRSIAGSSVTEGTSADSRSSQKANPNHEVMLLSNQELPSDGVANDFNEQSNPSASVSAKTSANGSSLAKTSANGSSLAKTSAKVSSDERLLAANQEVEYRRSRSASGWSMTIYGENGAAQKNVGDGNPYLMSDQAVASAPDYYGNHVFLSSPIPASALKAIGNMDYTEEVKHHHPISAGLQVGYNFTQRLRLTTGLVYTYTSSDYVGVANKTRVETTQKLHYLGIPLSLSYGVWKTDRFHTYITAGGEGDVNIKNHTETDGKEASSKRDRMQWSVNAAVGAQYDFIPQLGIYVEPGAKYYFDNGSQIENAFKDKKFNFNLQLGLRWNIK